MMRFVYQEKLEFFRIEFGDPVAGYDGLYRGDCDIRHARGVFICHLNLDCLIGVSKEALPCSLLDELASVNENQGLCGILPQWFDRLDELCEDYLETVNYDLDVLYCAY